jgi:TonB family protein
MTILLALCLSLMAAAGCEPSNLPGHVEQSSTIRKLNSSELKERVISCAEPHLPGDVDATGAVVFQLLVDEDGQVKSAQSISGHPILRAAALHAVTKWKFKPLLINGRAQPFSGVLPINVGWNALNCADNDESAIRAVLDAQAAAWNRGDVEAYMDGYDRSPNTEFVGGDSITRGWQEVLDRYKKRYDTRDKMGTLTFSDLKIDVLSGDAALVLGRWRLKRASDEPHGTFTLLFRKTKAGWRIVHDHTSSA